MVLEILVSNLLHVLLRNPLLFSLLLSQCLSGAEDL